MADEAEKVVPEEKKKKSPVIMIVVLVLIGLILAGGISYFVTTKMMTDSATAGGSGTKHHDPGVFIKLGDAKEGMIVNVGGIKSGRFLKLGVVLEMNPGKKDNVLENKLLPSAETKIMDTTLQMFRTVKLEDLDATKQDALKSKLKEDLNKVLGEGSVYDVYITSFVLQ